MDIQQIADGVHFVEASHTNLALVEDGDAVTVIDTGYPRDRRLLAAAIESIGHRPSDCAALVLTHGHVDHSGGAAWLRREAQLEIHCHEDELFQVTGPIKQQISSLALLRRFGNPKVAAFTWRVLVAGGAHRPRIDAATTFVDGERLSVPGSPVAIHTPGHTSGHAAFHLPDRGVLVTGDALCTINLWDDDDHGPQMVPRPFVHDWEQSVASLDALAPVAADVILPGHGQPWTGSPADAVAAARARL